MAVITINGTNLTTLGGRLLRPTMEVIKARTEPDSARFSLTGFRPAELSEVRIYQDDATTLVFGGVVLAVNSVRIGRGLDFEADWDVDCVSFSHQLQRHRLTRRFPAQSAGATVREAVAIFDSDIDTTNVQDGPILPVIAWSDYPLTLIRKLADLIGWYWRVDAQKRLFFAPRGSAFAPQALTNSSRNFADLKISWDAKTIRNAVTIRGGVVPSSTAFTDTFTGATGVGNFKLSYQAYANAKNPLQRDRFSPQSDYKPDQNAWLEFDVTNPSPPNQSDTGKAPITGTDGYCLVDNFGFSEGACQFVGTGPGAWTVGIVSKQGWPRQEDRYLYASFIVNATGDALIGWHDGLGIADTDFRQALLIESTGQLHAWVNGAKVTISGPTRTYATGTNYSALLTLKAGGGFKIEVIGGAYGTWSGTTWTTIYDGATGTDAILYAAVGKKSADLSVYELRVADPILGLTVTVAGVKQKVGLDNVDTTQVDCLINADSQLLRFFTATTPTAGAAIVATYKRPIPILIEAADGPAIAALAALTGETGDKAGRREYLIKDESIDTLEQARTRGAAEIREYANPVVTADWETMAAGFEPDQVVGIAVGAHEVSQDFLVDRVEWRHFSGNDYDYRITAGSRLKGLDDLVADLIAAGRQLVLDPNTPLEFLTTGDDPVTISETIDKLTIIPDVSGNETVAITEIVDELGFGPTPPYLYGSAIYGRATYA